MTARFVHLLQASLNFVWAERTGQREISGNSRGARYAWDRNGIISLIPTFLHETVTRTVRATVIFAKITGRTERKIVTAKDFEFSPRKESAAESTLPFPHMCMHYACTVALREKCLGSRKARGAVALSLFASLSPFLSLCMRRYQSCIKCAGVCVCRYRGSRCAQLCWRP